jgi:alkylhydroperoxidase/carboxymuconolactone decarboxylase family protein YurZ
MDEKPPNISNAFMTFAQEAPQHAAAWNTLVQNLSSANELEPKTASLAYLAVLAALDLESGIPFHVRSAKQAGATRAEVISAILVGLPAAGHGVTRSLPVALAAFNEE